MRTCTRIDWQGHPQLVELPSLSVLLMHSNLSSFQRRFPLIQWNVNGVDWTLRDTDQDAARIPLVLLPGASGTGDVFYRTVEALRDTRRAVSISYPALDDADAMVSGLLTVLTDAGIDTFDLFGSSLGGYLAQLCALREPQRVRRCMFANTFHDARWLQKKISREKLVATSVAEHLENTLTQLRSAGEETAEKADFKHTMLALVGSLQTAEMAKSALMAVLGAAPVPKVCLPASQVALLDTRDDSVVDEPTREAMRERYLGSKQFRLATGGHYPALLNPTEFTAALMMHFKGD
jgi:maspardin